LPKDLDEHEMIDPSDHQDLGQALWNLVLPSTPDVRIKKIVKTNSTVAYIVEGIKNIFELIKIKILDNKIGFRMAEKMANWKPLGLC
jgi:hypothetical protein